MPVIASKPKGSSFLTPEGTHQAVCYGVWDIGQQKVEWKGQVKFLHKVVIAWEINETIEDPDGKYDGKRYVISNFYTLSLANKANLKRDLESWRGKAFTPEELNAFDLEKLIGANCLLNIIHKETETATYANIAGVMPITKGMQKMAPENPNTPPEWVIEKRQAAIQEDSQETPFDEGIDSLPWEVKEDDGSKY